MPYEKTELHVRCVLQHIALRDDDAMLLDMHTILAEYNSLLKAEQRMRKVLKLYDQEHSPNSKMTPEEFFKV